MMRIVKFVCGVLVRRKADRRPGLFSGQDGRLAERLHVIWVVADHGFGLLVTAELLALEMNVRLTSSGVSRKFEW